MSEKQEYKPSDKKPPADPMNPSEARILGYVQESHRETRSTRRYLAGGIPVADTEIITVTRDLPVLGGAASVPAKPEYLETPTGTPTRSAVVDRVQVRGGSEWLTAARGGGRVRDGVIAGAQSVIHHEVNYTPEKTGVDLIREERQRNPHFNAMYERLNSPQAKAARGIQRGAANVKDSLLTLIGLRDKK